MSENPFAVNEMFDGLRRLVRDVSTDGVLFSPALDGVVAAETLLCTDDGSYCRGYQVDRLASAAHFPEVAWLLLNGQLPSEEQYADFRSAMNESYVDPSVSTWIDSIPMSVSMVDTLRSSVGMLGHFDAQPDDNSLSALTTRVGRLMNQLPTIVSNRFRMLRGLQPVETDPSLGYVANVYRLMTGSSPSLMHERALGAWMTSTCNDRFDTSAFAARVTGSSTCDLYAILAAPMATFAGRRQAMRHVPLLRRLLRSESVQVAEKRLRSVLQRTAQLNSFTPVIRDEPDPRVELLSEFCRELAQKEDHTHTESIAARIEEIMYNEFDKTAMSLWPGIRLMQYLGIDDSLLGPLMMVSRLPIWAAHAAEQSCIPQPVSPVARYIGPRDREFKPLGLRG